jgi:hypothetical protein
MDNNMDGKTDYPTDPGCSSPTDNTETTVCPGAMCPACSDGIDNDADGLVDYPSDKDCATPVGVTEDATGCTAAAGHTACATLVPTSLVQRFAVRVPVTNWSHVVGYLDTYQFTLPAGPVEVPCLVLTKGAVTLNPCQDLGGRYVSRGPALVDEYLGEAKGLPAVPFATIGICTADLVVTVDGYATTGPPAYTVC